VVKVSSDGPAGRGDGFSSADGPSGGPLRNVSVTASCLVCQRPLPSSRRMTCGDACRPRLWRRRHQPKLVPPPPPAGLPRKAVTVYECPECATRLVGVQFCEDCRTFMRRVGVGGLCPCCEEPVAFEELAGS
jgi:hypothetical protein